MGDLKVQYDTLQESHRSPRLIGEEFSNATQRRIQAADAWGSSDIGDAMHDFTDNWDRHRKKLIDAISALQQMTDMCVTTFRETDRQLAAAFDKTMASG